MKKQTLNITIIFITLFFGLGAFFPFNSIYLQDTLHYSGSQIGLFYSLAALVVVISVPLFGIIADKIRNPKLVYIFCAIAASLFLIPFSFLKPFYIIVTLYVFINAIRSALIPLADTIALDYCAQENANYGMIRSLSSLAFILASLITGYLLERFEDYSALFIYIHTVLIVVSAFFMAKQKNTYQDNNANSSNFKDDLISLLQNKQYLLIIIIMGLSYGVIQVSQAYISLSILDLGGNSNIVGISFFFLVIPEVIFFTFVIKFTKKVQHIYLMLFGALCLLLRWIILYYTNSIPILLFVSSAHGIVMAFIVIVGFDLIKKIVKGNVISSAMSIYTGLANIFFSIISFIAGYIIDNGGIDGTYLLYFVTTLIIIFAIIIYVIFYSRRTE
ncbi:PPP family 3-phenylpropionic acid transporter [Bacilli bacterium PM5-9]|nr:PPP family 3-phenylpropionic acid transporter [Bacilli bacterium PM5-9]